MVRTRYKNTSGIYQIQSIINGKIYIGSSIKILTRKVSHFKELRRNIHHSILLQRHSNKYGIDDLKWVLLEYCSKEKLIEREQYYINTLKPAFNISPTAYSLLGIIRSERTKRRMSKNHADFKGENHPNYGKHFKRWRPNPKTRKDKGEVGKRKPYPKGIKHKYPKGTTRKPLTEKHKELISASGKAYWENQRKKSRKMHRTT